jgi:hypothetical protein
MIDEAEPVERDGHEVVTIVGDVNGTGHPPGP